MTEVISESLEPERTDDSQRIELSELLTPSRVAIGLHPSSKKRLLEELAALLLKDSPIMDRDMVFQILTERERLGSTGIGEGVALPHGRLHGITAAIGAVAVLRKPLEFDAIDQKPVTLVFGLLVPAEASEAHLHLLARLATMLSDASMRNRMLQASDADALYRLLVDWHEASNSVT